MCVSKTKPLEQVTGTVDGTIRFRVLTPSMEVDVDSEKTDEQSKTVAVSYGQPAAEAAAVEIARMEEEMLAPAGSASRLAGAKILSTGGGVMGALGGMMGGIAGLRNQTTGGHKLEVVLSNRSSYALVPYKYHHEQGEIIEYARPLMNNEDATVVLSKSSAFNEEFASMTIYCRIGGQTTVKCTMRFEFFESSSSLLDFWGLKKVFCPQDGLNIETEDNPHSLIRFCHSSSTGPSFSLYTEWVQRSDGTPNSRLQVLLLDAIE